MKKLILTLALCAAMDAATLVNNPSTFDGDTPALDVHGVLTDGWTVTPTLDVVGGGSFGGLFCHNDTGLGRCLDMDGTSGGSGRIIGHINGIADTTYTVSFWLSGSQRNLGFNSLTDTVNVDADGTTASYTLPWDAPWTMFSLTFTTSNNGAINLRFEGLGSDDVGLLLDDISIRQQGETPEPVTTTLCGLGLIAIGLRRRAQTR